MINIPSEKDIRKIVNSQCQMWNLRTERYVNTTIDRLRRRVIDLEKIMEARTTKIETGKNRK